MACGFQVFTMAGWEIGRTGAFEVTWTLLLAEKSPANIEGGRADGAGDGGFLLLLLGKLICETCFVTDLFK
jgi:hypothetical protein